MKNSLRPHGIDVICSYEVDNQPVREDKSQFEGYIEVENFKMKSKLVLPMRTFVNGFINSLHGILSGDGEQDTRLMSVSATATAASNVGIVLGTGDVEVQLSQTNLIARYSATSSALQAIHKGTTLVSPYSPVTRQINFDVRRLISNASSEGWTIKELGVFGKRVGAATSNPIMLSRDHISPGIQLPYNADIRITFRFVSTQGTTGGINLNFARAIFNLMFAGNINNTSSRIIAKDNSIPTYVYNPNTPATSSNPLYIGANAAEVNGIVVGYQFESLSGNQEPDRPVQGDRFTSTPPVPDETTFTVNHANLTVGAVTISPVSAGTGLSKFTITRDFTNSGTGNKLINRIGVLGKGNVGSPNTQPFILINKPNLITLQPQQTLRVTYTVQIQKTAISAAEGV